MIRVRVGDLFQSQAQTWVNTVNCVGVMGKGIALGFKKRFPRMFEDYAKRCQRGDVRLGHPYVYRIRREPLLIAEGPPEPPELIVNFPTKEHWRSVSKLSAIVAGLERLREHHEEWGITSMAVPPLGCGHGQLDWDVVGPTLYEHLRQLAIPVELYAPHGTPEEALTEDYLARSGTARAPDAVRIRPAHVALAAIVDRVEREPLHWPVGRIMLQKIAFFATDAGLPTGLDFVRGSYGPYAKELKAVVARLENNGVLREERSGQAFLVFPGPTFESTAARIRDEFTAWGDIIERVSDLVLRMTSRSAELAATVVFVARELARTDVGASELEVWRAVREWKLRRRPAFTDEEIGEAVRSLNQLGWTPLEFCDGLPLPAALALE